MRGKHWTWWTAALAGGAVLTLLPAGVAGAAAPERAQVRAAADCAPVSTVGRYCGYHAGTSWAEYGSRGSHVKEIQALVNRTTRYGTTLAVDGICGADTRTAVTWFQWYYGSEALSDGIVGPKTWELLRYGKR
ncbi:peptidoglycan-binding domain-containing protein [Streptomyces koyangensis]|uniref:peptidoglycan-binding domain-containing protein n=1 Tax=Streptomyces koyangensis TaxID=188770 RepID=UPI003C300762